MSEMMEEFEREIRTSERKEINESWIQVLEEKFGLTHKQAKELAEEVEKLNQEKKEEK